ncbi:MAG: adenylosuccinate lyase [Bacteroidales bacterium]|jgi:adenylosuccinate lyase|nr:adenylosuccinate lyase [Bacteroidales bacterium]
MNFDTLLAISPIDGRYAEKTEKLHVFFSEYAVIKYRVYVEIEYFIALLLIPLPELIKISQKNIEDIRKIYENFAVDDAQKIKNIEKITNHDVKAVEYFIKEKFDELNLSEYKEFIHFGLTSQDINNTAFHIGFLEFLNEIYLPEIKKTVENLKEKANIYKDIPMLAHTHGQPASPTNLGKEIMVFVYRLEKQIEVISKIPVTGKFGGAVGNFNAHKVACPDIDWVEFANKFLYEKLNLAREQFTTQISNYDALAATFDAAKRINTILIDCCRDFWQYISMEYFKQKINKNEVGSSAMPHKVNPIDFENAEGNLGMANAVFEHLSAKLPISRLQRDLTDSTVLRNIGVPCAHTIIALKSLQKGLDKLIVNEEKIHEELENNWIVVAEAIQTILRKNNYPNPYEALKELTRTNSKINKEAIQNFINSLNISDEIKNQLLSITPFNYTGYVSYDLKQKN